MTTTPTCHDCGAEMSSRVLDALGDKLAAPGVYQCKVCIDVGCHVWVGTLVQSTHVYEEQCGQCGETATVRWLNGAGYDFRCDSHRPEMLEGGLVTGMTCSSYRTVALPHAAYDIDWDWIQQVKDAAQKSSAALDAWSDPSVPVMGSEREAHNLASCEFDEALGYAEGAVLRLIGYIEKLSGRRT